MIGKFSSSENSLAIFLVSLDKPCFPLIEKEAGSSSFLRCFTINFASSSVRLPTEHQRHRDCLDLKARRRAGPGPAAALDSTRLKMQPGPGPGCLAMSHVRRSTILAILTGRGTASEPRRSRLSLGVTSLRLPARCGQRVSSDRHRADGAASRSKTGGLQPMELVYVYGDSESESGSHGDSDPDSARESVWSQT